MDLAVCCSRKAVEFNHSVTSTYADLLKSLSGTHSNEVPELQYNQNCIDMCQSEISWKGVEV